MVKKEEIYNSHKCPVCGKFEFDRHGSFDFCDVCGWCDDLVQEDDPNFGGFNPQTLNGYRALYTMGLHKASDKEQSEWFKKSGFLRLTNEDREEWLKDHGYYDKIK